MVDFLMSEAQQPIIIHSSYFKGSAFQLNYYTISYLSYKQLSSCYSVELESAVFYVLFPLIDQAPHNDVISLTT